MADETLETFDAVDPAADANARREVARIAREDADVLRLLMHTKPGRAWLFRFLAKCNIMGDSFAPGQPDVTAFRLGQENIGRQLWLAAQGASIDLYMQMVKEQQAEEKRLEDVRRTEERKRRQAEEPTNTSELMPDLPPPAGYPGGPPLPDKKKTGKAK